MRLPKLVILIALAVSGLCWAQDKGGSSTAKGADKATAYYNYTLAHMYAQLAADAANRTEYVDQAIEHYKAALAADPSAREIAEELGEVYLQFDPARGRTEAQAAIAANPDDVAAHRLLARIYLRQASDTRNNRLDANMLRQSIEEYKTVTRLDPQDVDSWVLLGRLLNAIEDRDGAEEAFQKALDVEPDNEDALVGMASVYLDRGDNAKAAELYKKAADQNPSAAALERLASAYEQMREFELAAETLKKALDLNPPDADAVVEKMAEDLVNAGKWQEAIAAYEAMAAASPDDASPQVQISRLYLQLGDVAKAREAADKAKALEPDDIEVQYNEAGLLQAEGRIPEAIQALGGVLDSTKRNTYSEAQGRLRTQLLQQVASLNLEIEHTDEAVAAYRELIDLNPGLAAGLTSEIINAYRGGKEFDKAQAEADAAVKRWPDDRQIAVSRASLQADMGKVDEAAAAVRKFLDGTNDRAFQLVLAGILEKGHKWKEMGAALDAAEKLSQDDMERYVVYFQRGAMYEHMKDISKAEAEFRKCLAISPDDPGTLNYLGYMLADRDTRLPEALSMIQKAVDKEPGNGAYLDSLGWVYFRMGRYNEAEQQIRRAVELMPNDPTMHDHFAQVLIQQSKVREAIAAWEESLRRWQASAPVDKDTAEIDRVRAKLEQARSRLTQDNRQ